MREFVRKRMNNVITVKDKACKNCGGACCKAFFAPPLKQDIKELLMSLYWMMPWRVLKDIKQGAHLFESIGHRIDNVILCLHKLLFRAVLVKVDDPWFLARGSKGSYAVTCRLFRNDRCLVYGWLGDHVRPEYCRTFSCHEQPDRYIYKQYEKETCELSSFARTILPQEPITDPEQCRKIEENFNQAWWAKWVPMLKQSKGKRDEVKREAEKAG